MFLQFLKYLLKVLQMFFIGIWKVKKIIQVYTHKFSEVWWENCIHSSHRSCRCITISLRHDLNLPGSKLSCCNWIFNLIFWLYSDLVVCIGHVDFRSKGMAGYMILNDMLIWNWFIISDSILVLFRQINYPSNFSWCFLWYSEYWSSIWRWSLDCDPFCFHSSSHLLR